MKKAICYGFIIVGILGLGFLWYLDESKAFMTTLQQYVENGDVLTLEVRYTPEEIMKAHQNELLGDKGRSYQNPELTLYPYLMIDVKYTLPNKKTKEGVILWSLVDGEMVIDTATWEKTHGFEDAINASATLQEFRILNVLAAHGGSLSKERLQKELHIDADILQPYLEGALEKHLIIVRGSEVQLHFQDPKFLVQPQTKMSQPLVTKPLENAKRFPKTYSQSQIVKISRAAFGPDFTIRDVKEVFLPVYTIPVLNSDGSILTTFWNALTGQRIHLKYHI